MWKKEVHRVRPRSRWEKGKRAALAHRVTRRGLSDVGRGKLGGQETTFTHFLRGQTCRKGKAEAKSRGLSDKLVKKERGEKKSSTVRMESQGGGLGQKGARAYNRMGQRRGQEVWKELLQVTVPGQGNGAKRLETGIFQSQKIGGKGGSSTFKVGNRGEIEIGPEKGLSVERERWGRERGMIWLREKVRLLTRSDGGKKGLWEKKAGPLERGETVRRRKKVSQSSSRKKK